MRLPVTSAIGTSARRVTPASALSLVLIGLGLVALPVSTGSEPPEPDRGVWRTAAPAPTKRTEVAAATLGGKIYVVGGFEQPGLGNLMNLAITASVEEYDPSTDRWTHKAPLPVGLHHVGIGVTGGRLYVIGGYAQSGLTVWHPVATVYAYDPATDTWSERAPMPTARGALSVTEHGGKLFAIGGYDRKANSAAVEIYDPERNAWASRAPLPTPRDHLAAATVSGKVYAIGGRLNGDYRRNLSVTEVYDPITDRWARAADLPTARSGITASEVGGWIYVFGGEGGEGTFRQNEAYDPARDAWQTMAPMPTGRHGLGSAVANGRIYVISGGPTPGGSFSNLNEVFTPPVPPAPKPGGRASARQVGAVMALLASFQDAGVLPPETSPDANRLIKALIQYQAAFMRSTSPAVNDLLERALAAKFADRAPTELWAFRADGWTSERLEAVVDYVTGSRVWDRADLLAGLEAFNVGPLDFDLVAHTFLDARRRLATHGLTVHEVYARRRLEMPGAALRSAE
jgi:N-acetylneuraminic acid mutarotase